MKKKPVSKKLIESLQEAVSLEEGTLSGRIVKRKLSRPSIRKTKLKTKKSKKSEMKSLKAHIPFKSREIKDVDLVIETLLDCIKTGDRDAFREVLSAHLMTINKLKFAKKAGIGRRTLYDLMNPKKEFNPELSTVSALIQALAA